MTLGISEHASLLAALAVPRQLVTYEFRRLANFGDPRMLWVLLATLAVCVIGYIVWLYRREQAAVPPLWRWLFPLLRIVAWSGAALYFLGLEKRVDQQIVTDSQVVLLVDTSQSMSVADVKSKGDSPLTRGAATIEALGQSPLVASLLRQHDVELTTFDRDVRRVANWKRGNTLTQPSAAPETSPQPAEKSAFDWQRALQPSGSETRLGDSLQDLFQQQREGQLAGVIVVTDGVQNCGLEPLSVVENAEPKQVPIFSIGIGSSEPRRNLRIQEVNAPSRVYPDDRTTVTGIVQAEGFAGRTISVQLFAREVEVPGAVGQLIGEGQITFDKPQQSLPVEFQFDPREVGRLALEMQIVAPNGDQYDGDNQREVEVEVVEANSRVLLIAGGPARDYQFIRNQLFRDPHTTVDIWLQTAAGPFSQEADQILREFPASKEELYEYDAIVAFDPNWELLDASQVESLEAWVAEEAGGLIVVAGPIHTQSWSQSPEFGKIRALYPVEFQRRLTLLDDGNYGSKTPWPLLLTREGEEAEFLWLADNEPESQLLWSEFPGVFGCFAVKGAKAGARVLAWYSDPDASLTSDFLVYMAEHFYGSGRVLFLGSGELWRLRELDPGCFEILSTRLIRHVSQGRLLKGSSLGRLVVEQDRYTVGSEVVVRAQLLSPAREPLLAERVIARAVDGQGNAENLTLLADASRPGNFLGQFSAKQEGSYRIELALPERIDEQLVRRIQVVVPDLEFDNTRRNEELLTTLADRTGGKFYPSFESAIEGDPNHLPIEKLLPSRAETRILRGTPDNDFSRKLNQGLLAVICGALCLEWLCRRLLKLA